MSDDRNSPAHVASLPVWVPVEDHWVSEACQRGMRVEERDVELLEGDVDSEQSSAHRNPRESRKQDHHGPDWCLEGAGWTRLVTESECNPGAVGLMTPLGRPRDVFSIVTVYARKDSELAHSSRTAS